ncbi:hypothetical protein [Paenarthrobacter nicotinovorans]|uniref:hypothetical protein n=1 Tax=Paenarthrobacter nicotinovorans TaxID=29320 RepID=UPI0011A19947|nr:hypothetical protein [Paenarthrobacter nicotinovorans]
MNPSPAKSLSELMADADTAGHDHAATEKNSGLRHIHNHATGAVVWFPTWQTFRQTSDWEDAVAEQETRLNASTAEGTPLQNAVADLLTERLDSLLERAAQSPDANVFVQDNLTPHLTETWAIADAAARASGADLPAGTPPAAFSGYPYHVYAEDGGAFATALWNDVIDARRHRAIAEEAARKALKPVSRKALKNAARKAARR